MKDSLLALLLLLETWSWFSRRRILFVNCLVEVSADLCWQYLHACGAARLGSHSEPAEYGLSDLHQSCWAFAGLAWRSNRAVCVSPFAPGNFPPKFDLRYL